MTLRVPPGDATIGDEPFVMLDIFHPVREDFIEKVRKQTQEGQRLLFPSQ